MNNEELLKIYVQNSVIFFIQIPAIFTRVAHGSVVCTYMSRAKLFRNPLLDGPGTTFGW